MSRPYAKNDVPLTPQRLEYAQDLLDWSRAVERHKLDFDPWMERRTALLRTMETIGVITRSSTEGDPERLAGKPGATA